MVTATIDSKAGPDLVWAPSPKTVQVPLFNMKLLDFPEEFGGEGGSHTIGKETPLDPRTINKGFGPSF